MAYYGFVYYGFAFRVFDHFRNNYWCLSLLQNLVQFLIVFVDFVLAKIHRGLQFNLNEQSLPASTKISEYLDCNKVGVEKGRFIT
jgi:hypothetical protein